MQRWIDIRSDTVTQPTREMRQAMFEAEVGDDVYGDDPTVNELERLAAEILGKESALFVPSGTMGNQVAVMTHTRRGDEVVASEESHVFAHEVGAAAVLSGVSLRTIRFGKGMYDVGQIAAAIRSADIHEPPTTLILLENALANGRVATVETMAGIHGLALSRGIRVHLDGARFFNASAALGISPAELARHCDSIMCCLSKGLCAPVGSVLAGTREFIARSRKNRKMLGGGMRQAGFLAAAGIIAIRDMTSRLAEDHDNARHLACRLSEIPGLTVDMDAVQINMVFFKLDRPSEFLASLPGLMRMRGIKINGFDNGIGRFVTHHGVNREDLDIVADVMAEITRI
jgi:threonine aldolase